MNIKAHRIGFVALVVSATLGFAMKTSADDPEGCVLCAESIMKRQRAQTAWSHAEKIEGTNPSCVRPKFAPPSLR
jgi:hypothetical protein